MAKTVEKEELNNIKMLDKKVDKEVRRIVKKYENANKIIQFFIMIWLCIYFFGYNWIVRNLIKLFNSKCAKAFMILVIMSVLLIVGAVKVYAFYNSFGEKDLGRYKYYTQYTVQYGDTIWSIASDMVKVNPEYNSVRAYGSEIMTINECGDSIKSGQILVLPYYSTDEKQTAIIEKYIMQDTSKKSSQE